ncbi:hypothetical protein CHS0354_000620 [Potamilus streckersoni]|uniref:Ribonuclease n=1 Tax=Potamilus streckersoni TaxID=2493646 RepID=A0AAE0T742_9BIVA|nr:hypothetical protein CHS0354_000620 [Potamilus streckersoni]
MSKKHDSIPNEVSSRMKKSFSPYNTPENKKLILVGNPNVGKSTIFNYLTKLYVDVSNYPGTTLDITSGRYQDFTIVDTPGVYGISSFNDEEKITRDIVLNGGIIVNVIDATTLERDLFLTLQLIDMDLPMVVALNMIDKLDAIGETIDAQKLEKLLGVPVIPISATSPRTMKQLETALSYACSGCKYLKLCTEIQTMCEAHSISYAECLLLLEGDDITQKKNALILTPQRRNEIYVERRNRVNDIIAQVVKKNGKTKLTSVISNKIGSWSIHPMTGIPILIFSLWLVYEVIGVFVAQRVVGHTEAEFGNKLWEPAVKHVFAKFTPVSITANVLDENDELLENKQFDFPDGTSANPERLSELNRYIEGKNVLQDFAFSQDTFLGKFSVVFAGEFGILTMTVTYLLFLLLPLVVGFYLMLAILEDCGYLPRLATLTDRMLNSIGLNGKAIIPIILGFGCVTMATITTRLLNTSREKTIAASVLNFAIPCSAQLAVITALLAQAGGGYLLAFFLIILTVLAVIGTVVNSILPGKSSSLLLDLPAMRLPRMSNVLKKTRIKTVSFMKEATPWFMFGAAIISVFEVTGILQLWIKAFEPITTLWLDLPKEAAQAFVMGIVRRDFGAAGLLDLPMTPNQILVSLVVITLFVPCVASIMALVKERGWKEATLIWLGSWIFAFIVGARSATNERNRLIASSIGVALPSDENQYGYLSEHHPYGQTEKQAGEYAEDLAATMLASTLGLEFDPDTAWDEREQIYKMSGKIVRTFNITQSAEELENKLWQVHEFVCGIDEVGRGCLAGPVVAAAVCFPKFFTIPPDLIEINDSKKLTQEKRTRLEIQIKRFAIAYSIAEISASVIDKINILEATFQAMNKTVLMMSVKPDYLLIDGNRFNSSVNVPFKTIIKGDQKVFSIAAASIIAKVYRDNLMESYATKFSNYGFETNVGYGTLKHREAIKKWGVTELHRKSFIHF